MLNWIRVAPGVLFAARIASRREVFPSAPGLASRLETEDVFPSDDVGGRVHDDRLNGTHDRGGGGALHRPRPPR